MADSKFSYVRALVQDGSLTNLATASPWTVTHPGGIGLTLTTASRILADQQTQGRAANVCAEAVVSLDVALVDSTVLSSGVASVVINSTGQLGCLIDGAQVAVLNIPLASQRVLCVIEYTPSGANESYFFRATGETTGGTVTATALTPALAYPFDFRSRAMVGGLLYSTLPANPSQGSVNVTTTRPGVLATAVPQIVSFSQANAASGFTTRQAASTGGSLAITASRAGGADVTYTITNTAGLTVTAMCSTLAAGIAGLIGGNASFSSGASLVSTATLASGANWSFMVTSTSVAFPAEPAIYAAATTVSGTGFVLPQVTQGGVYGAVGASVTQRNVVSLTLPAANANMTLAVSLLPTLNASANMGNVAAGLDSLVAQISAVGFTASWQQIGAGQYIINTERLTPGGFTLSASLTVATSSVPNPVTTLHGLRVTTAARYLSSGGMPLEFPTLPWPTTSIPAGGGGGGQLPTDVWLALGFEGGSATDLSTYAHTKLTQDQVTLPTTGSRTSDGYAEVANGATVLNYSADLDELNGLTGLTIEFDFYIPTNNQYGYFFGPTGSVYMTADTTAGNGTVTLTTNGWIGPLNGQGMTFSAGAWHHIAIVGGATNCRFFVDGVEVGSSGYGMSATNFSPSIGTETTLGVLNISSRVDLAVCAGLRLDNVLITKREKYTVNFTPPGAITGGGTGWGTLPADVIFAVNAESNANDVAQFGLVPTVTGANITYPTSGSRTGDGYIANSNGNGGVDARIKYAISPLWFAEWGASTSMTIEFDVYNNQLDFAGGQGFIQLMYGFATQTDTGTPGEWRMNSTLLAQSIDHSLAPLEFDRWYNIAQVADGVNRETRIYLDGVLVQTFAVPAGNFMFEAFPSGVDALSLLQIHDMNGNGSLNGRLDNIIITKRAKYSGNFTPGMTFAEIVGYTPPPSNVDVTAAGYNDIDEITGTGTFNTQLTPPDAYFFSVATLDDFGGTGNAYTLDGNSINFTGSRTLGATTCTGTFVRGTPQNFDSDVTLDDNTAVSTFYADTPKEWTGESTLDNVTSFGLMMFLAPAMFSGDSLADDVATSIVAASFTATAPITFRLNQAVPAASLVAEVAQYAGYILSSTVPSASCASWFGMRLSKTLPAAGLQSVATVANTLRLNAGLPRVEIDANILNGRSFSLHSDVPTVSLSAWTGWQLIASVPIASITGDIVVGGAYRLSAVVPKSSVSSSAVAENVLRLDSVVPSVTRAGWVAMIRTIPAARMIGHIAPVVATTRLAYSFTIANSAMTRYPAYPFIQVFRMGNAYYGVGEDGLYELGGTTDNGTAIPWAWETCMADFGQAEKKTVVSAYLGGYVPQNMTYTIKAGDVPTGTNAHTTTATAVLRNHRQKFGIGRKSRFFAFGLSATQGRVAIESIEFEMATMSRRV